MGSRKSDKQESIARYMLLKSQLPDSAQNISTLKLVDC
jgi:hypothetical protein